MSMQEHDFDYVEFSKKLEETLLIDTETVLENWSDSCIEISEKFADEFRKFQSICVTYHETRSCNPLLHIEKINDLISSIAIPAENLHNPANYRIAWMGALQHLKTIPSQADVELEPKSFEISNDDNQIMKAKKIYMKYWIDKKIAKHRKSNEAKTDSLDYHRKIRTDLFFRVFILLPIQQEILKSWNSYNRLFANMIHSFQEPFIKITALSEKTDFEKFLISNQIEYLENFFSENTKKIEQWHTTLQESLQQFIKKQFTAAEKKWHIAATPLCPEKFFNDAELKRLLETYGKSFEKYRKAWKQFWTGEETDWEKQIEISHISWTSFTALQDLYASIKNTLQEKVIKRLQFVIDTFSAQSKDFQKKQFHDSREIHQTIIAIRKQIEKKLLKQFIPETIDSFLAVGLGQYNDRFDQILSNKVAQLKEEYLIFKKRDSLQLLPESLLDTVPLKEMVLTKADELFIKLDKHQEKCNDTLIAISNELASVSEIVMFMEDTAQELIEHSIKIDFENLLHTVTDTVINGFQQAIQQTESIKKNVDTMITEVMNETFSDTKKFIDSVNELRDNDRLLQLKIELIQNKARKKIHGLRSDLEEDVGEFRTKLLRKSSDIYSQLHDFANQRYRKLSKIARLQVADDESFREISEYLKKTKNKIAELPAVYRRLYRFEALTSDKMYIERTMEKELLEQAYSSWKKGSTGLVALVGERGSGRTSFINNFKNLEMENSRIYEFEIGDDIYTEQELLAYLKKNLNKESAQSLEELEEMIVADEYRSICIFENIQQIFLKTIQGLELTKRFVLFTMRTDHNLFWLVSFSYYTWQFLNKVIGISSLFANVIFLKGLPAESLMSLILLRHRISGLPIIFAPGESLKKVKKFKRMKNYDIRQNWLKLKFFHNIEELSSGNVSAAILYWQNNIKLSENKKIIATVEDKIDLHFLQNLPENDLFAITVLIQHESITIKDFAQVLNLTMDESMLIITSLLNRGIVIEKNGKFELHFFLYRPLMRILYEKRLLH
jgi:tRNA A-37 threonylcarbamoyl transferase component Bud32